MKYEDKKKWSRYCNLISICVSLLTTIALLVFPKFTNLMALSIVMMNFVFLVGKGILLQD